MIRRRMKSRGGIVDPMTRKSESRMSARLYRFDPYFAATFYRFDQFFPPPETLNNTGTDFVNGSKSSMVEREIEQLHVIRLLRVKRRLFSRVK